MLNDTQRSFLRILSRLVYCNPFQPLRLELERQALGRDYQQEDQIAWSKNVRLEEADRPNVVKLTAKAERIVDGLREKVARGAQADDEALGLYQDLVTYVLYYRRFGKLKVDESLLTGRRSQQAIAKMWQEFHRDFNHYLVFPEHPLPQTDTPEHSFACLFQVRRAFRFVFDNILGDSHPAAEVRAMVWQSVFTHDMRRYRRSLYNRMRDLTTLITGPSGTGKELVARAISLSQYIPFDAKREQFVDDLKEAFLPVNLSALSPTLVESELFGHCKGAFTGALADRRGWLEACPAHGAVFLDEIGELDPMLQVKLLRVVQQGSYARTGETELRHFPGKLLAATNRDLTEEIRAGRFRADLFYRLCSDRIETPSLRAHLQDRPEALEGLIEFIARRLVGDEAEPLTAEVSTWIQRQLGANYPWPGNIRELEQCVRNILVRRHYEPAAIVPHPTAPRKSLEWLRDAELGTLTCNELFSHYCTWVYAKLGSYQQTAAALGLDRRTVRAKIDRKLLKTITAEAAGEK